MNESNDTTPHSSNNPPHSHQRSPGPQTLPAFTRQSWFLFILWPLLQIILLVLNARDFQLASGEMNDAELHLAHYAAYLSGFHICAGTIFCLIPKLYRWLLHPWGLLGLLAVQIGFLWWMTAYLGQIFPASVPNWILSREHLLGQQFMFTMPTVFFALVSLATIRLPLTGGKDFGLSIAALIAPPAATFLFGYITTNMRWHRIWDHFEYLLLILFILATLIIFIGLFRTLMWIYRWLCNRGSWIELLLLLVVSVFMPLAGLLLNQHIPFPFDFQSSGVYAMALLNGIILCLPTVSHKWTRAGIWFLQTATFPFTLYFFLVFIPFFPLALPAIVIAGAGFLILTPAALFFVHLSRLKCGFNDLTQAGFSKISLSALSLIALITLPGSYLLQCAHDRVQLHRAIDYVYSTNSNQPLAFRGNTARVQRSLESLRDRKVGIWLPFLTQTYSHIVFDGLVLPDSKLKHMYFVFTGREMDMEPDEITFFGTSSRSRSWRTQTRQAQQIPLKHNVTFQSLHVTETLQGESIQSEWHLVIHNPGNNQDEFVLHFKPSSGSWINDLKLKIGDAWEDGRLSERKAAIWIYQMIRDQTRRDPALLHYLDEHTVELRVFPLASKETREVRISFLHPPGIDPVTYLNTEPKEHTIEKVDIPFVDSRLHQSDHGALLWMRDPATLPTVTRSPLIHLLIDVSATGFVSQQDISAALNQLQSSLPDLSSVRISYFDLTASPSVLWQNHNKTEYPHSSNSTGRHTEGAVLTTLRNADLQMAETGTGVAVPALIIVSPTSPQKSELARCLPIMRKAQPDFPYLGWSESGETVRWHHETNGFTTTIPTPLPVHVARLGRSVAVCLATQTSPGFIFKTPPSDIRTEFLHSDGTWEYRSVRQLQQETDWSQAASLWTRAQIAALNPHSAESNWKKDIEDSKATGILSPMTAYIVVENSAQWRKLEEAEKKRLQGDKELDIMETPEPGTGMLLILAGIYYIFRSRRCPCYKQ